MLPLLPSKQKEAFSLLTGVQQDSRLESIISLQLLFLVEILLKLQELSVCSPILLQLLRHGQDWTTSSTSCTPREHSFTGMLEKVWRRVSSLKHERILLLLRRIMKRLDWTPWMLEKEKMEMNIRCIMIHRFYKLRSIEDD